MDKEFAAASALGAQKYPRVISKLLQYGTSGFREKASELTHVMYRMGLLAVLRSKLQKGSTIGVMITASHNPEEDNGVKLCDPNGKMLDLEWEEFATTLVNVSDTEVAATLTKILHSSCIDNNVPANVFVACDTRSSSEFLTAAALSGINILNGKAKDFGLMTTPQLHFVVFCKNYPSYGAPSPVGYYEKLSNAFRILNENGKKVNKMYVPEVYIDGANGVGALKFQELQKYINCLKFIIFNDGSNGVLNFQCGADYVKINQKAPEGCDMVCDRRYASLDGDADRLVYFYQDREGVFHLLDGDKIATLVAKYLRALVQSTGLSLTTRVIQTAYANGSSTHYIENKMGIPVVCVPTGVKYLHHEALKYDMGIYFEANGHGTVVFSEDAKLRLKNLTDSSDADDSYRKAAEKLLHAIDMINESVGDAISDLLLVETILRDLDWDAPTWNSLYSDLPNRQLKVTVPDRHAVSTTDAERRCVTPDGLQDAIDSAVAKYSSARSFVRPSGTENVVRVYAEADTQISADKLADEVSCLVKKFTC